MDGPFVTSYNLAAVSDSNIEGTFSIGLIEYPASVTVRAGTVAACAVAMVPPAPTIQGLMYQTDTGYADATAGPIYVATGTTVMFQAVSSNGTFPPGSPTWAGTSGASGTGQIISVTFNSRSASANDFKTVSATSGNTLTASVIVFDFDGVLTPDDNFEGRSLSDFGVGETIALSFTATPSISESDAGGLQWRVVDGGGSLTDNEDGSGSYSVPDSPGAFGLALQIKRGPSRGQSKQKNASIVAPSGIYHTQKPGTAIMHIYGVYSVGHRDSMYLLPKNVSFRGIVAREGGGTAQATGYLEDGNNREHSPGEWFDIGECNSQTGCRVIGGDEVSLIGNSGPFSSGTFDWPIDQEYRLAGSSASGKKFTVCTHHGTADAQGTATSEKAGAGPFTKRVNDPTSPY